MAKKSKKLVRRSWTRDDLKMLKQMGKAKAGVGKIARFLKRSPGATAVVASKHGISLSTR